MEWVSRAGCVNRVLIELFLRVIKGKLRNIVTKDAASLLIDSSGGSIFLIEVAAHTPVL